MKRESKLWIYFLLQLLEQLMKQAREMPNLIRFSIEELEVLKDDLFALTIEQTIDSTTLTDAELQKEVLSQLLFFLNDPKRFPQKKDLLRFAQQWDIQGLTIKHSKAHLIGALYLGLAQQNRHTLERLYMLIQGDSTPHPEIVHPTTVDSKEEDEFTWFDYMESRKK